MAKTYTAAGSATAGDVYTSSAHNVIVTDVNNLIVPPACQVRRTSDLTSYASNTDVTFNDATFDTDGMFSAGSPTRITIQTTGLYVVSMVGALQATATLTRTSPYAYLNGTTLLNFSHIPAYSSTNNYWAMSFTHAFTAGDFITHRIEVNGGSSYIVRGAATIQDVQTRMAVTWIGRTS